MPKFLNSTGHGLLTIGICARCQSKFYLTELSPDPNAPGLLVCRSDRDVFDPWRLPAPLVEQIGVPNARPDESIDATGGISISSVTGVISAAAYPTNLAIVPSST